MFVAIVAFVFLLLNLVAAVGVFPSISVQALAILDLVGFAIVLIVAVATGFVGISWPKSQ